MNRAAERAEGFAQLLSLLAHQLADRVMADDAPVAANEPPADNPAQSTTPTADSDQP